LQPSQCPSCNKLLLRQIYCVHRSAVVFPRAGFYFDKNQRITVATDNIHLTAAPAAEVPIENFVTVTPQVAAGKLLAARAKLEMLR